MAHETDLQRRRWDMRGILRVLRPMLFTWDPIGFGEALPEDEYDCVVGPLVSRLREEPRPHELAVWLGAYAQDHFGVSVPQVANLQLADAVLQWWHSDSSPRRRDGT